ncbi:MAG: response regulator [Thermaurantimonas sp.]
MNILIIDDNQIDLLINQRVVLNILPDAHVKSSISAIEAIQYLNEITQQGRKDLLPDIILLDIRMPMMDGFEFLEKLIDMSCIEIKRPNVIMVTSSIDPMDINKSNENTLVKGFIGKPLKINQLRDVLKNLKL